MLVGRLGVGAKYRTPEIHISEICICMCVCICICICMCISSWLYSGTFQLMFRDILPTEPPFFSGSFHVIVTCPVDKWILLEMFNWLSVACSNGISRLRLLVCDVLLRGTLISWPILPASDASEIERSAEYRWKPHRDRLAQEKAYRAPRVTGMCVKRERGTVWSNSRFRTLLRPVHLLRVSLPRVLESNFSGDSLWNYTDMRIPTPEN